MNEVDNNTTTGTIDLSSVSLLRDILTHMSHHEGLCFVRRKQRLLKQLVEALRPYEETHSDIYLLCRWITDYFMYLKAYQQSQTIATYAAGDMFSYRFKEPHDDHAVL